LFEKDRADDVAGVDLSA